MFCFKTMENKCKDELNHIKAALIIHIMIQVTYFLLLVKKVFCLKELQRIYLQRNVYPYFTKN